MPSAYVTLDVIKMSPSRQSFISPDTPMQILSTSQTASQDWKSRIVPSRMHCRYLSANVNHSRNAWRRCPRFANNGQDPSPPWPHSFLRPSHPTLLLGPDSTCDVACLTINLSRCTPRSCNICLSKYCVHSHHSRRKLIGDLQTAFTLHCYRVDRHQRDHVALGGGKAYSKRDGEAPYRVIEDTVTMGSPIKGGAILARRRRGERWGEVGVGVAAGTGRGWLHALELRVCNPQKIQFQCALFTIEDEPTISLSSTLQQCDQGQRRR
ncbi:hypothetical protein PAXRUDRAFT_728683 [Paxillus rubicundulus Ve08.2h10]|uniref:Uncharacterized protein n=1 Tax=Paxillus rubicundulus Ve08.2h10 TaxID=930991 RepID=A0A0D0CHE3_9AGAM|nr:hypothetical protein PAXRUDRAFT_728683 [Paxillus rubicundulus Ve08.2h10]